MVVEDFLVIIPFLQQQQQQETIDAMMTIRQIPPIIPPTITLTVLAFLLQLVPL